MRGLGPQGKEHGIHDLATEGCVVQQWREGMADGVSCDAKDTGRLIEMLQTIEIAQYFRFHLTGRRFGGFRERRKGECCSCARTENPAHKSLFAHSDADDVRGKGVIFDDPQNRKIVGEGAGGRYHFYEIGLERFNAVGCLIKALGPAEVVKADEQGRPGGAEFGELG